MTYAQFKTYILAYLWRTGDAELTANLDTLILAAEARLNRDLRVNEMLTRATGTATDWDITLPTDHRETQSFKLDAVGTFSYVTGHEMDTKRAVVENAGTVGERAYTTRTFMELAYALSSPGEAYTWNYYTSIPAYAGDDTAWPAAKYLDVYQSAVLIECYDWLRDNEESAKEETKYLKRLDGVNVDAGGKKYGGSPLKMSMPSVVA
jgi:hypothetical protein